MSDTPRTDAVEDYDDQHRNPALLDLCRALERAQAPKILGAKSDNAQETRQAPHVELANARQALKEQAMEIAQLRAGRWIEIEKAKADAYEDAASRIEKLAEDYTHEHGSYDGSTNAWELHHRHGDRIEAWDDAVEAIRKRKAEKCQVTHAAVQPSPTDSRGSHA